MHQCKQTCLNIAQLELRFNPSWGTIWDIVQECLSYRKVFTSWISHLTNTKKKSMGLSLMLLQWYKEDGEAFLGRIVTGNETWVFQYTPESKAESVTWKHPHSPVNKKFKKVQSPGKIMATAFWDVYEVIVLVDFIPPSSAVNAAAYQETKQTQRGYSEKWPGWLTTGVLLHDNAQPHTAAATVNPLNSWKILPHQPYSPDLPPLDFHIFSEMTEHLRGQWFHPSEDINEVKMWLCGQGPLFFYEGLDNW